MQTREEDQHTILKRRIEDWLEAEGISFESVPDFNSHFHVKANLKNIEVHVTEPKVRRGVLAVQAVVSLDETQLSKVVKVKPEDKRSIFLSLFSRLDRSEYLFVLQEDFTSKNWLRIQRALYIEDLTRTSLLSEMKGLNTKFVNMNYELNLALDSTPVATGDETIYS
ncbi:MAG: DUF2299 family protein [Thaumarchaeota archaeon]|nr:DUF2299 family protein [Nitrososphaerota archaeon]